MKYIYPSLLKSANNINIDGWFDIKIRRNKEYRKQKKRKKKVIESSYIDTYKIKLLLTLKQKNIIKLWLDDCIDIYNITNNYIKNNIKHDNIKEIINYIRLRKILKVELINICSKHNLNKHTADYAVHHCVTMYKSALSNHNNNIDKFKINDLFKDRRRKNLVVEPASVSSKINSIFIKQLGLINSSSPLKLIKKNSILQFDSIKNNFFIISPYDKTCNREVDHYKKCGIDIGVRTFITTYSRGESYEIGTNNNKLIDKYNNKLDSIKSNYSLNILSKKKYMKSYYKYSDKLKNSIEDLHNKTSNLLLSSYKEIIIGKVSIKKMISNLTGNIQAITKRRLVALSHYKFREKLKSRAFKFGCKITEVSEYLTSKTCSNCYVINDNLGSSKIFNCSSCNLCIDRDINASINIYKNKILKR
jgi:IS605 OrfB family transposase